MVFFNVSCGFVNGQRGGHPARGGSYSRYPDQSDCVPAKNGRRKDGKKGPLLYHVRYNPRLFLTTSPVLPEEKAKEDLVSPYSKTEELDWWEEPDLSAGSNAGVHSGQDWGRMEEDYWSGDVSAENGEMGSGAGNEIKENADSASSQVEDEWW